MTYVPLTDEQLKVIGKAAEELKSLTYSKDNHIKEAAIILYNSCLYRLNFDINEKLIKDHLFPKEEMDKIIKKCRKEIRYKKNLHT